MIEPQKRYRTAHLELASYIHASNSLKLAGTEMIGHRMEYIFDGPESVGKQIEINYHNGAPISAVKLFNSHKTLRRLLLDQRDISQQYPGASSARPSLSSR